MHVSKPCRLRDMRHTQNGDPISVMSSTMTWDAFPTVSGTGRAKVVDEPPAVPAF